MSTERKRVEKKEIPSIETRKRNEVEQEVPVEKKKTKPSEDKFIKIASNANQSEFKAIGEKVQKGEVRWSMYCIDNGIGYHYYKIIEQ